MVVVVEREGLYLHLLGPRDASRSLSLGDPGPNSSQSRVPITLSLSRVAWHLIVKCPPLWLLL